LTLQVQVPRKLKPLLYPKRYKGAYGGRGGAKSHFFAEQVILACLTRSVRVVCIREVQNTIKDSVRQLLADKITKYGLQDLFGIFDSEIRGPNNSFVVFKGMQSYNAANIKSLEGFVFSRLLRIDTSLSPQNLVNPRNTSAKTIPGIENRSVRIRDFHSTSQQSRNPLALLLRTLDLFEQFHRALGPHRPLP